MNLSQQQVFALIGQLTGTQNVLVIPRLFIDMLDGDLQVALFLSQLLYWSNKGSRNDGYIYKSYAEWTEEIGLTQTVLRRARQALEDRGWLDTKLHKANGAPTLHYKVVQDTLVADLVRFVETQKQDEADLLPPTDGNVVSNKTDVLPATNGFVASDKTLTETTTETTVTETTTKNTHVSQSNEKPSHADEYRERLAKAMGRFQERQTQPKAISVGTGDPVADAVIERETVAKRPARDLVAEAMYQVLWPTLPFPDGSTKRSKEARKSAQIAADRVLERIGRENYEDALDACYLLVTEPTEDEAKWLDKLTSLYGLVDSVTSRVDSIRRATIDISDDRDKFRKQAAEMPEVSHLDFIEEPPPIAGPDVPLDAVEEWKSARDLLQLMVAEAIWRQHGQPIMLAAVDGDHWSLSGPKSAIGWISTRLRPKLQRAVDETTGRHIRLTFHADGDQTEGE